MKKLITACVLLACCTGCMTQSVSSLDADRIIDLSRQAIAEAKKDINVDELEFTDITHRYDSKQNERITIGFRHSPKSESETTEDDVRSSKRTITKFKAVIVTMDKTGKILSVDGGGASSRITVKSTRKKTVQQKLHGSR